MIVQSLLNAGDPYNRNRLEHVADGILAFPRALWLDHKVVFCDKKQTFELDPGHVSFTEYFWNIPKDLSASEVFIMTTCGWTGVILYVVLAIIAAPFLAIGLCFKKFALALDANANQYHKHIYKIICDDQARRVIDASRIITTRST